jgi:hypothetical protein
VHRICDKQTEVYLIYAERASKYLILQCTKNADRVCGADSKQVCATRSC